MRRFHSVTFSGNAQTSEKQKQGSAEINFSIYGLTLLQSVAVATFRLHSRNCVCHAAAMAALRACVRTCVCAGSWRLGEAVIWHVSECVWANQTEGPL